MFKKINLKLLLTISFSLFGAALLSTLILGGKHRFAFLLAVLPAALLLLRPFLTDKNIVKLLIVSAFFPLQLNYSTTNLGPTSQYIILGFFTLMILGIIIGKSKIKFTNRLIPLAGILFTSAVVSTVSTWDNFVIFRTSFWALVMLMACLSFLILVDSLKFRSKKEQVEFIFQSLDLIVLLTCIQIIIGAIVYFRPEMSGYLSMFYSENTDKYLQATITDFGIRRLRTLVFTVESLGEFIPVLMPYVLYRLSHKVDLTYIIYIVILLSGLMLSVTRSGILLTLFVIGLYTLFIEHSFRKKIAVLLFVSIGIFIIFYFDFGVSLVEERFFKAINMYTSGGDVLDVSNRSFFRYNFVYFLEKLSFWGNGLVSPLKYGVLTVDFHNLYLTIFFQYGVLGALVYFSLPLLLVKKLWLIGKDGYKVKLNIIFLLSIACFFINECKFEYTRQQSGVLIIWMLFSIYFLYTKTISNSNTNISCQHRPS